MPDTDPSPADIKARNKQAADEKETGKFFDYASKFQKVGNAPRSYSPSMENRLLAKGGYNPNTLTKGAERERALEAGERQEYLEKYKWPSYKKGGKVKKTGLAKLHKGEFVVPKRAFRKGKKAKLYKLLRARKAR